MKTTYKFFVAAAFLALASCATEDFKQGQHAVQDLTAIPAAPKSESSQDDTAMPPPSKQKDSELLKLVRLMEGGACKNDDQGAKGIFLLYSSPHDIERIQVDKGTQIFADFEKKIQAFSLVAFDRAVKATNIALNPFALDSDDAQHKVAQQLIRKFGEAIASDIKEFQEKTTLTIDVVPFARSFEFYINGCEATHVHPNS